MDATTLSIVYSDSRGRASGGIFLAVCLFPFRQPVILQGSRRDAQPSSFHRRGHLQRLMNTAEVVMAILQSWTGKHRQPVPKRAGMRGGGLGDKVTVDITAVG